MSDFNYDVAFARNIGWVTHWEQQLLKSKVVAIAGLGGVGGLHLLSLARLGVQNFHISDFDKFGLENFNRQVGATMSSIGQDKLQVLTEMALEINPNIQFDFYQDGINEENVHSFLSGVDIYVDGMDFFNIKVRELIFDTCEKLEVPFVTAGPIGMGVSYLIYLPGSMSPRKYFGFDGRDCDDKTLQFLLGLNPKGWTRYYIQDPSSINLVEKRGPSVTMACQLCSAVASTQALKILLNRGKVYPLPYYHVYDPYLEAHHKGKLRLGCNGPLHFIKRKIVSKQVNAFKQQAENREKQQARPATVIEKIIDLARWAPSGDNTQPWQFYIKSNNEFEIVFEDEGGKNIFDFGGVPSYQTVGVLLETIDIAATKYHYKCNFRYVDEKEHQHRIKVGMKKLINNAPDPLADYIEFRSVDRKSYQQKSIPDKVKAELGEILGDNYEVVWVESLRDRVKLSYASMLAMKARMKSRKVFDIQQHIIDFDNKFSKEKMPVDSINLDSLQANLFKMIHNRWPIYNFIMKYLMGSNLPAIQSEFIPGIKSSALIAFIRKHGSVDRDTLINEGRMIQRFWLTTAKLGLSLQPNYFPMALNYYKNNEAECLEPGLIKGVEKICDSYNKHFPLDRVCFLGRIGWSKSHNVASRSIRKHWSELIINSSK